MCPKYTAKAILALTLALTLSIKIAVGPTVAGISGTTRGEAPLAAFLERQGFNVGALLPNIDPPMIPASKAGCTYRIAQVDPGGVMRDVLAQLAGPSERLFFVFRGKVFVSQPTWATFLDYKWRRLLAYVGYQPPQRPILGIIASEDCTPKNLPWGEVAEISLRADGIKRCRKWIARPALRRLSSSSPTRMPRVSGTPTMARPRIARICTATRPWPRLRAITAGGKGAVGGWRAASPPATQFTRTVSVES